MSGYRDYFIYNKVVIGKEWWNIFIDRNQIALNETRDKLRETNQKIVDLEESIVQLKEDLIQERADARMEKKRLKKAVVSNNIWLLHLLLIYAWEQHEFLNELRVH